MVAHTATCLKDIQESLKEYPEQLHVLNFWAAWAEPCIQMNEIVTLLSAANPTVSFWDVDAEAVADAALHYLIEAVPTFVLLRGGQEISRINGAKAEELTVAVERAQLDSRGITTVEKEDLNSLLGKLIHRSPVMIFIKGTPSEPRCGFTRQLLDLLNEHKVQFGYFDIFTDEEVRQGLKVYSNWPTYPQVYIRGELVGGLDIVREMIATGQFQELIST